MGSDYPARPPCAPSPRRVRGLPLDAGRLLEALVAWARPSTVFLPREPRPPGSGADASHSPFGLDVVTFPGGWGARRTDSSLSPVFRLPCDLGDLSLSTFPVCRNWIIDLG